ncbi:hypothetical protein QUA43_09380 [Microcoleus sp. N9_B4]
MRLKNKGDIKAGFRIIAIAIATRNASPIALTPKKVKMSKAVDHWCPTAS